MTEIANKSRAGLMGPEHAKTLEDQVAATAAAQVAQAEAVRALRYFTRWIAG